MSPLPPGLLADPFRDAALLAEQPAFRDGLAQTAEGLMAVHEALPREVRYLSDLRRWMLSQAALALDLAHRADPSRPPLSPAALTAVFARTGVASRNTISSFLSELEHYGLILPQEGADRRRRGLRATPRAEALLARWFTIHLAALDALDGGARLARLQAEPQLFALAQPAMLETLLCSPGWQHPPEGIALFTRAESGSNLLHHLAARAPASLPDTDCPIGSVTAAEVAERFLISSSHAARLLNAARAAGLMTWEQSGRRGTCRIASALVRDYRRWQAEKFIAVAGAWDHALANGG